MATYPNGIYSPRAKENRSGVVYDATKKTVIFVEDINKSDDEVVAVETELGTLPKGTSATVQERIKGIRSLLDAIADTLIIKGGNVGIGTASPASLLEIYSSTANSQLTVTAATSTDAILAFRTGATPSIQSLIGIDYSDSNKLKLVRGSDIATSTGLTIDSSGNVGIGTVTPNNLLSVYQLIDFNNTDFNTKLGYQAGLNIVAGAQYNTFLGYQAGFASSTGSTNAADYNIGIGYRTLYSNTTGYQNFAIGAGALYSNTTGYSNSAIGLNALYSNTTGYENFAIGLHALNSNTTSYQNSAIGLNALQANTTGNYNTAIGLNALYSNTTGGSNTAIGLQALRFHTIGHGNAAIGPQALYNLTGEYHYNVAVGYNAGRYQADGLSALTTPSQSVYIGSDAMGYNNSDVNSIVIGYMAKGIGANKVVLGNDSITTTALKGKVGIGTTTPTALLDINSDILRLRTAKTPATAGAAGNAGDICWDANYVYVCVAINTWKRAALVTW